MKVITAVIAALAVQATGTCTQYWSVLFTSEGDPCKIDDELSDQLPFRNTDDGLSLKATTPSIDYMLG